MSDIPEKCVLLFNSNYEVIENIVKNLYLKDLYNASLVSKSWYRIAKKYWRDTSIQITVANFSNTKSNGYIRVDKTETQLRLCLTVMDYGVYDRYWYFLKETHGKNLNKLPKYKGSTIHHELKSCMPSDCESILVNRPARCIKYLDCTDKPMETLVGYVTLGFPDIPGVTVQPFELDTHEKNIDVFTKHEINNNLKFLLIFKKSDSCDKRINEMLTKITASNYCICNTSCILSLKDAKHERDYLSGIAFSGDNFYISKGLNGNFEDLKKDDRVYLRHNSLGFIFYTFKYEIQNDLAAFSSMFPNTPLFAVEFDGFHSIDSNNKVTNFDIQSQVIVISWQ